MVELDERGQRIYEDIYEAYIFAYPLVETVVYGRSETNTVEAGSEQAPYNQFAHNRNVWQPQEHKPGGPNMDVVYSMVSLDLKEDALIFHKPQTDRFYTFLILDAYGTFRTLIGTGGLGGEKTGDYLIAGPGFSQETPAGVTRIDIPTRFASGLLRIQTYGGQDVEKVHALQKTTTIRPLSQSAGNGELPKGVFRPEYAYSSYEKMQTMGIEEFFSIFNEAMEENPILPEDLEAYERYKNYQIGAGKHFATADFGDPALIEKIEAIPSSILWKKERKDVRNGWSFADADIALPGEDYFQRAYNIHWGPGANPAVASLYPMAAVDRVGNALTGANAYVIHFEKGEIPPVKKYGYWSITPYTLQDLYLIENDAGIYKVGSETALRYNEDGSLDLYIQREEVAPELRSNWLPVGEGAFLLLLRLYIPEECAINGAWKPPFIERRREDTV